jgi:hypothetical protein
MAVRALSPARSATVASVRTVAIATSNTEGVDMTYTKPSLKRLGSLAELTLTNASCDYSSPVT